ncbi:hypothetical protein [Serratia proteamaculans]|uniref:hypothetical protein n=1 Tax=Serratia proteamaculans TaxID=28151 RepID=UPI0021770806|nr:hypothetical protein [Serratia proteamaculans]CAI0859950.1 Uncharacterised protein [Serratia proteamaculans]CAI2078292.1 Uncharacterised protein [Serratia proteamaculans]
MHMIIKKIISLLRGRPALTVGGVSVWGNLTEDEKDRFRRLILSIQEEGKGIAVKRIAELEAREIQLMQERDNAETALADMYEAATGQLPVWSNWLEFAEAVAEVAELRKRSRAYPALVLAAIKHTEKTSADETFIELKKLRLCNLDSEKQSHIASNLIHILMHLQDPENPETDMREHIHQGQNM